MKKLLLIRHAKATHENNYADFERPLKQSGIQDAAIMAKRLQAQNIIPQAIISSPALRTITTANVLSEHLSLPAPQSNENIYEATDTTLLNIIDQFPDSQDFIALVGHNPGISHILYNLTGKVKDVKPGGIAFINFDIDAWKDVGMNNGNLLYYDEP